MKMFFEVLYFYFEPSPPLLQLQHPAGRELCGGEGHQQHHGGPVLQDEEGPGRDVEHCRHWDWSSLLLPPLLPGSGVSWDRVNV